LPSPPAGTHSLAISRGMNCWSLRYHSKFGIDTAVGMTSMSAIVHRGGVPASLFLTAGNA
jgi:hypothetical protein